MEWSEAFLQMHHRESGNISLGVAAVLANSVKTAKGCAVKDVQAGFTLVILVC